jgi:hypothetical protein
MASHVTFVYFRTAKKKKKIVNFSDVEGIIIITLILEK